MQTAQQNRLPKLVTPVKRSFSSIAFLSLLTLATLSGCGGGADSQSKPTSSNNPDQAPTYTGVLKTQDIRAFKKELWEKLSPSSVCGRCHRSDADPGTRQAPYFVDWQDVNFAYDVVVNSSRPLVNLADPASSVLVQRVSSGHQCWLATTADCRAAMISYIEAWANGSKKGKTNVQVQVEIPTNIHDPGDALFFPKDPPSSYTAFHNLVTNPNAANCTRCHSSTAQQAITPYFADPDLTTSYNAVKTVMNINDIGQSRIVLRLAAGHNCWVNDNTGTGASDFCPTNTTTMKGIIQAISDEIAGMTSNGYDLSVDAVSKAMTMLEGNVISSGNRYEDNQIALYEFKSGEATGGTSQTIYDTSGVEPELDLTLYGNGYRWLNNWGIEFSGARALASVEASRKLYNLIRLTGEYSIEAWVIPANVTQENATIIAYSGGSTERNAALGQTMYNYDFYQRSSTLGPDGQPKLMTNDNDQDLQATLQHVVITYDRNAGRRIYVNGKFTGDVDQSDAGDLLNWHPSYVLSFGNELSNDRPWSGTLRMVAIHDRALTPDQVRQNYAAEVGQKYLVPFSVSHLLNDGVPNSYVVFEVSMFDEFSYLFRNPRFINVDPDHPNYTPPHKALRGLRIGMNGQDVSVGQAYTHISIDDLAKGYSPQTGLLLSNIDTVIQTQNGTTGPNADEFFLTFEQLADRTYNFAETDQTTIPPLPTVAAENKPADIGVRTYDEINASMAEMTGITDWQTVPAISSVFATYRQQLPAVETMETFLSSHQMAIAQLAMGYCNELQKRDEAGTATYFPGFAYTSVLTAFSNPDLIINPLLEKMLNATDTATDNATDNLQSQPSVADVRQELNLLIVGNGTDRPGMIPATCTEPACTDRTRQIVKAACASVLGSAVMLVQ